MKLKKRYNGLEVEETSKLLLKIAKFIRQRIK